MNVSINGNGTKAQFMRFLMTGCLNSLVTIAVIFVCKSIIGINPWVSNALGYIAGVVNSFVWNKMWVFRSHGGMKGEALRFVIGFCLCYTFQLAVTWILTEHTALNSLLIHTPVFTFSGYSIATLAGMCCYTVANFVYNRAVAFNRA